MRVVHFVIKKKNNSESGIAVRESGFSLFILHLADASLSLSLFDEPADRQQIPLGMEVRNNKQ